MSLLKEYYNIHKKKGNSKEFEDLTEQELKKVEDSIGFAGFKMKIAGQKAGGSFRAIAKVLDKL